MKIKKLLFFVFAISCLSFLFAATILASSGGTGIPFKQNVSLSDIGISDVDKVTGGTLATFISNIAWAGTSVLIVFSVFFVMLAGVRWIVYSSNSSKVGEAKSLIMKALIGLVIGVFSVTILNLVNPATTDLASITPDIEGDYVCCNVGGTYEFKLKAGGTDECAAAGGTEAKVDECILSPGGTAPKPTEKTCDQIKPGFTICKATCDPPPDEKEITGLCTNSATPKCCEDTSVVTAECDASTPCTEADRYCQKTSTGATTGKCILKEPNGGNCNPDIEINNDEDKICMSGECDWVAGGTHYCIPVKGTGNNATNPADFSGGDFCTNTDQCQTGGLCYEWIEDPLQDSDAINKNERGYCILPSVLASGWMCEDVELKIGGGLGLDAICDRCPAPLVEKTCGVGSVGCRNYCGN